MAFLFSLGATDDEDYKNEQESQLNQVIRSQLLLFAVIKHMGIGRTQRRKVDPVTLVLFVNAVWDCVDMCAGHVVCDTVFP